jgi:protease-4
MAGLENYRIVDLPKQKDPIEELLKGLGGNVKMRVLENELGESAKYFKTIDQLRKSSGVMARMPYEIILN